ncbi:flagellar biosynthesis protein FliS [Shewanella mangrovi]|uniref:Flagellar secretion chaperone FliS n=1 Tax=Shewanella mangrovi TaxID=1515746 RepID=A0A094JJG3_9GAMM|nr:flagellar export chaperone FliS [Shewanella mangrovi]KFZ38189.1 flagellar biosynthesis protein FliS [Shewanella mangrovi]
MFDTGYSAYKNTAVEGRAAGADVHQLVLMLFDGFLEELERAIGHINGRRFDRKAHSVEKMLRILGGLEASLDLDKGGELANNMARLYDHCGQMVLQASLRNQVEPLDNVRQVMTNLQQGWKGIGSQG